MYNAIAMPVSRASRARGPARTVRAALMLRVSTEEQARGYGLDVQERAGRTYISSWPGWTLSPEMIFRDEGVSGAVIHRPGMLRLEQAARQGLIDVIVVHNFDRIGRTGRAFWAWIWAMEDLGVSFVSVMQDIDIATTIGLQQLQAHALVAETEGNLICERTQGGRQRKALEGGWVGGPPPWGYAIEGIGKRGSTVVVNEAEAKVVLSAVSLIVDGNRNVSEVAEELNSAGCFTRSGRPWTASNLHRRLRSPSLLQGEVVFRKPAGSGANRTKLDEYGIPLHGDSVVISIPRIITAERAEALEKAMAKNGHSSHAASGEYLLTGRIVGNCGESYVGAYRNSNRTRYYRCGGGNNGKGKYTQCADPYLTATDVESAVWREARTLLAEPGRVGSAIEGRLTPFPGDIGKQRKRVAEFEKSLVEKEKVATRAVVDLARIPGLDQVVKDAAVKQLNEDVRSARDLLAAGREVLAGHEEVEEQTRNLMGLIEIAREKRRDLTLSEARKVIDLLDITVKPLETLRKRSGVKCKVTEWHERTGMLVPAEVPEPKWPAVEELMTSFFPRQQFARGAVEVRTQVNGVLFRLRNGCLWSGLPERYGPWALVKDRQNTWFKKGFWHVLVEHLNSAGGGAPVKREPQVPPLEIRGRAGLDS
ncbi:recombinase family protein [Streptomyces sp. SAS_270]|uniref:recombinase family protein n=1 Tax=Streptomyces sp. SAS_270 TaxID=3412748 RepID=UPI00403CBDB5